MFITWKGQEGGKKGAANEQDRDKELQSPVKGGVAVPELSFSIRYGSWKLEIHAFRIEKRGIGAN